MKIHRVLVNNRKAQLELVLRSGKSFPFPFAKLQVCPCVTDRIREAYVDPERGNEAVTYVLASGAEGAVRIDQVLEYNQEPGRMAELLAYKLTVEAASRVDSSGLSRRELARRLRTSVPQLYRLLDPANTRKSLSQLVSLLQALDCVVDVVVKARRAA
jgi:hypothetical protein